MYMVFHTVKKAQGTGHLNPLKPEVHLNNTRILSSYFRKKHNASPSQINWLMLCREILIPYSSNHTKPIYTLCGFN
jgi:hypothetical protein